MEKNIASRIKELRSHYQMSANEFGIKCGLSSVAIYNIENGKIKKPQNSSLHKVVKYYGTTDEWLRYGIGSMLPNGNRESNETLLSQEKISWKEEAYFELKNKNEFLESELERLWRIVNHLTQQVELRFITKN
jgi:transcriptional regulator with XRE-family HTH domain